MWLQYKTRTVAPGGFAGLSVITMTIIATIEETVVNNASNYRTVIYLDLVNKVK